MPRSTDAHSRGLYANLSPAQKFEIGKKAAEMARDVHKINNHVRSLQEKLRKKSVKAETSDAYIFGSIWAFAKILFANFCSELFRQSFLPPKFCIVQYIMISKCNIFV